MQGLSLGYDGYTHNFFPSVLSVQDRKVIIKSLKGLVCKVCQEENGYLVMMALFDCVDDTVLLRKAILSVSSPSVHM